MKTNARLRVTFLTVMGSVLAGCAGGQNDKAPAQPEARHERLHIVTLTRASIQEIGLTLWVAEVQPIVGNMTVPSKLLPNQDFEAQVGSLVQGRVQKVLANVGDAVGEGQELMHIEGLEVG